MACLEELYKEDCPQLIGDIPNDLPFFMNLGIEDYEQLVAHFQRFQPSMI